jgi:envelope integrity protein B
MPNLCGSFNLLRTREYLMQKKLLKFNPATAAIMFAVIFIFLPGWSHAVTLVSHRAVYDLTLDELRGNAGIEDVRGRIVMEMEGGCEGYTMNQRMVLELSNSDGSRILSDYILSSWEEKSGDLMRFTMTNSLNGRTIDEASGLASRTKSNGNVQFDGNKKKKKLVLPGDVVFPVEHTMLILNAAEKGENLFVSPLFDGNGEEGLSDTTAIIGKVRKFSNSDDVETGAEKLIGMKYWPMQLAFFDQNEKSQEPDYEVRLQMFENGVARALSLQYADFSLTGKLSQLDYLSEPDCK